MTVTASSPLAKAIQCLIDMVAASTTFQNRVATYHDVVASEAEARNHIYCFDVFDPRDEATLQLLRPFALVGMLEQNWSKRTACSTLEYWPSGSLLLVLEDNARFTDCHREGAPDAYNDSFLDACNFFDGVMADFSGAGMDLTFPPTGFQIAEPIGRPDIVARQADDFWSIAYSCRFGEGGGEQ